MHWMRVRFYSRHRLNIGIQTADRNATFCWPNTRKNKKRNHFVFPEVEQIEIQCNGSVAATIKCIRKKEIFPNDSSDMILISPVTLSLNRLFAMLLILIRSFRWHRSIFLVFFCRSIEFMPSIFLDVYEWILHGIQTRREMPDHVNGRCFHFSISKEKAIKLQCQRINNNNKQQPKYSCLNSII